MYVHTYKVTSVRFSRCYVSSGVLSHDAYLCILVWSSRRARPMSVALSAVATTIHRLRLEVPAGSSDVCGRGHGAISCCQLYASQQVGQARRHRTATHQLSVLPVLPPSNNALFPPHPHTSRPFRTRSRCFHPRSRRSVSDGRQKGPTSSGTAQPIRPQFSRTRTAKWPLWTMSLETYASAEVRWEHAPGDPTDPMQWPNCPEASPVAASDETRRGALPTPAAPVTYPPPNLIPCSVWSGRDVRRIRGIRSWFISLIYKWHVALSRAKMISLLRQARQMNGHFLVSKNIVMVQYYYSRAGAYSLSQITMSTDSRGICCVSGAVNSFLQLGEIWTMVLKFVKELASMHLFPQTGLINALKLSFYNCQNVNK